MDEEYYTLVPGTGESDGTITVRRRGDTLHLLPPAPDDCQVCGGIHAPEGPHNPKMLYYRVAFSQENGRYPTWEDAMAHCPPAVQEQVRAYLKAIGIDTVAEYLASLASAANRTVEKKLEEGRE